MRQTTPYTVTLQPGAEGLDTYLSKPSQSFNYGAAVDLKVSGGNLVSLVQFDLSSIPAGSDIQSAQLSLYHTTGGTNILSVFRVTRAWTEGTGNGNPTGLGATWASADGAQAWTSAGGDYDLASGVATTLSANGAWSTWDLTAQTAAWIVGIKANYGIALVESGAGSNAFASSDDINPALRPKLDVRFLPPCGWVPAPTGVTLAANQDTWIDENGSGAANYGGASSFTVTNGSKAGRGLVRFDLSSVPPGTLLTSAKLRLYVGSVATPSNSTLTVNRAYDPWVEGTKSGNGTADGATWKTRNGSNAWSAGFGIYWGFGAGEPTSTSAISSSFSSGWVEWNVTALAQQWVDGVSPNYGAGVLIDTPSAVLFNSRQAASNQPQLVLTW